MTAVLCVLPARIGSERIPRKPLQQIAGRPLVEWSWRAASAVPGIDAVWVATDSPEIEERVREFGGTAYLTSDDHASGTDRVAEVARRPEARSYEIVVNYQADEPFVDPDSVAGAVDAVRRREAPVATVAVPIRSRSEWRSEACVKIARAADGRALYFSRAPIPHPRGGEADFDAGAGTAYLRHVGVYACRREALERWARLEPSPLERLERLEQLRILEAGWTIRVVVGPPGEPGVDEPRDLRRAERLLRKEADTVPIENDG